MMNTMSIARRFLPRDPAVRSILQHGGLAVAVFVALGLGAQKYLGQTPYGVLAALLLVFFLLGLLHTLLLSRYPWASNDPFKASCFTLLLTATAVVVLLILLRGSGFAGDLAVIPFFGMSVFFVDMAVQEWNNMPEYLPPSVTLEDYTAATGLRVFEKSNTFVQFRIHDKTAGLPYFLGWSVAPERAFQVTLQQLFSAFLLYNNFNENGARQVSVTDSSADTESSEPYRWSFYVRTRLGFGRRYLLPHKSLQEQRIRRRLTWHPTGDYLRFIRITNIYVTCSK